MSDEHPKPVKPELDYHLDKKERVALLAATQLLSKVFEMDEFAMPEFFTKAAHDLALILKEQEHCTCTSCENRRNAAKSNWN